jgi:hypothetical protein
MSEYHDFPDMLVARLKASGVFDDEALRRATVLVGDPGWAAALTIFSFPPLAPKSRPYLHLEKRRIEVVDLLEASQSWSSGECALAHAAVSLFNGRTKLDLADLMGRLHGEWVTTLIVGLFAYKHTAAWRAA